MPYQLQWEKDGVYVNHYGRVTSAEIQEVAGELQGDDRYEHASYQITNLSKAEDIDFNETTMKMVGSTDKVSSNYIKVPMVRIAVIDTENRVSDLIAHYKTKLDCNTMIVNYFTNTDIAREWALGHIRK